MTTSYLMSDGWIFFLFKVSWTLASSSTCTFTLLGMNEWINSALLLCLSTARRAIKHGVEPLFSPLRPPHSLQAPPLVLDLPPREARSCLESMWASGSDVWARPAVRTEAKQKGRRRGEESRAEERSERRNDAKHSCYKFTESCRTLRWSTPACCLCLYLTLSAFSVYFYPHLSVLTCAVTSSYVLWFETYILIQL